MRSECVERAQLKETEGTEETQRAACKQVWLDPHPVVIMDTCACICVCVCLLDRERKSEKLSFCLPKRRMEPKT